MSEFSAFENPLDKKLGVEFFRKIPQKPGIYFFRDEDGDILYVGKAKNLKLRLASYRRAKPGRDSKKIIRLLQRVTSLDWQECVSEKQALLEENKVLRDVDPEFNVLNTTPERYYYVGIRVLKARGDETCTLRFRLTRDPECEDYSLFGCYRNGRGMKEGYGALLRLIWAAQNHDKRFSMPARLARRSPPYNYETSFPIVWLRSLAAFLEGRSHKFLEKLTFALLENRDVPEFMRHALQRDIATAREFFRAGPRRNRRLKFHHDLEGNRISQYEIDDLLVHDLARRGLIEG